MHSEPCVRGHRTSRCTHTERILVRVRKPGRPLHACPHQFGDNLCSVCDMEQGQVSISIYTTCRSSLPSNQVADDYQHRKTQREGHDSENQVDPELENAVGPHALSPILLPSNPRRLTRWNSLWVSRRDLKVSKREASVDGTAYVRNGTSCQELNIPPASSSRKRSFAEYSNLTPAAKLRSSVLALQLRQHSVSRFWKHGGSDMSKTLEQGYDLHEVSMGKVDQSQTAAPSHISRLEGNCVGLSPLTGSPRAELNQSKNVVGKSAFHPESHSACDFGALAVQEEYRLPPIRAFEENWLRLHSQDALRKEAPLPSPDSNLEGRIAD